MENGMVCNGEIANSIRVTSDIIGVIDQQLVQLEGRELTRDEFER